MESSWKTVLELPGAFSTLDGAFSEHLRYVPGEIRFTRIVITPALVAYKLADAHTGEEGEIRLRRVSSDRCQVIVEEPSGVLQRRALAFLGDQLRREGLLEPTRTTGVHGGDSLTVFPKASPAVVAGWLQNYTKPVSLRRFTDDEQGLALQVNPARQTGTLSAVGVVMDMSGLLMEQGEDVAATGFFPVMRFSLMPLSAERTELTIECMYYLMRTYSLQLIHDMLDRWPEIAEQVGEFLGIVRDGALPQPAAVEQAVVKAAQESRVSQKPPEPKKPEAKPQGPDAFDDWFLYYHAMEQAKRKYTFKDMARDTDYSDGYLRQLHAAWLDLHPEYRK